MEKPDIPITTDLTEAQAEDLQNLKLITNLQDDQKARFYMQMCNYNIDQAINLVLETEQNLAPHISDPTPSNPTPAPNPLPIPSPAEFQ